MMRQACIFLCFFVSFLALFSSPSQSLNPQYSDCAPLPYACGTSTFNVSYPFKAGSRPDYCGYPGYYLTCSGSDDISILTIAISNKPYAVLSIDYLNDLLNVVYSAYLKQTCPQPSSNTAIDASLYQFSDRNRNLTVYTNCSSPPTGPFNDSGCFTGSYYRLNNGTTNDFLGGYQCGSMVEVPLGAQTADDLVGGRLSFAQALQRGFYVSWTTGMDWCGDCVNSGGYCGYNRSWAEDHICFCANGTFIGSCYTQGSNQGNNKKIIIGICVGLGSVLIWSLVLILRGRYRKKVCEIIFGKRRGKHTETIEAFLKQHGSLVTKRYTYSDIRKMTKSFSEKLGQGGYGTVYKGKLFDGRPVAVKVLSETKGDGEDFINEVAAIGNTSHVNVVRLQGFCVEGSRRALIYDFMPMGSLEKYICSEKQMVTSLGWESLYEIAVGTARGLEYLHRGCNTRIVHFDIKPHNILLDQDLCPKISDFGMAKLCNPKQSAISMYGARGTVGYIAPEVFSRTFGVVSSKSDVYSYGMMVLDMFGGKRSISARLESVSEAYFPQSLYQHLNDTDYLMEYGVTGETEEIARKMMIIGFWCIQTMPENRPSMTRVVDMLEGSISDLPIPPKPLLSPPPEFMVASCTESCSHAGCTGTACDSYNSDASTAALATS